jgi:hypothetical protein
MELDEVIDELYALEPAAFTARRDALAAQARQTGDRTLAASIKALRKPSVAAYTVNLMTRTRTDEIEQLIDLGKRLRAAQEALDADDLRALGRQRSQLVAGLAHEARSVARHAGHPITDATEREVEATFEAGLADPAAGAALLTGSLVRALERSGLDPVDLAEAVAGTGRPAGSHPPAAGRRVPDERRVPGGEKPARAAARGGDSGTVPVNDAEARARAAQARAAQTRALQADAEAHAAEAAARNERAESEHAAAVAAHKSAEQSLTSAEEAVQRLTEELQSARRAVDEAEEAERTARRRRRDAEEAAQTAAEAARTAADEALGATDEARAATDEARAATDEARAATDEARAATNEA